MVPAVSSWPTRQLRAGVTRRGTGYAGQAIRDCLDVPDTHDGTAAVRAINNELRRWATLD